LVYYLIKKYMSYFTKISYSDTGSIDAFSRLRTSAQETLFSTQCQYSTDPVKMESFNTGTGVAPTHSASTRMVALSCTAGSGTSGMQSYQYSPYEPGKSQFIAITGVLGTGVAGATVDVGYFDANNGVIFRQNGTTNLQLILRTSTGGSVSDSNIVAQSSWNIDKLDGTGASGITLDVTKSFIMIIDLQFLGMGRVRVGFDINGVIYYVHQFLNANNLAVPYMQSATLPIGMLITASATATTKTSYFKCATVQSEGGQINNMGLYFSTPEATVTAGNGTRTHLLSLRPKTTFNSITNRETFAVDSIEMTVTGNAPVYWELCLGQAISGTTTFNDINTTYSGFEYNTAGTLSGSPAIVVASGYVASATNAKESISRAISAQYPITLDRAGAVRANGTLTLVVTGIGANSATRGTINFKEIR
jgi:hypothetical protein